MVLYCFPMKSSNQTHRTKFIFITGGVLSSLGKGLAAAAIGALLESRGLTITFQKLDPYINVDPGTMNPFQHGEVYVTDDGAETDLDLGHYERYTSVVLGQRNNYTTGRIYHEVISKERRGEYLGGTVQVIPHITDEIKRVIMQFDGEVDLAIIEIGGTIGDIESLPFLEAIRQLRGDIGRENSLYIHVTWVPFIKTAGEVKTKPTQHSVKELRGIGIQPDILLCRTAALLTDELKSKIALFTNVDKDAVITARDVDNIYEVPLCFYEEGLDDKILEMLNIWTGTPQLAGWHELLRKVNQPSSSVLIAVIGKYVELTESYKSLHEALVHGGLANNLRVELRYVSAEEINQKSVNALLVGCHGILVPGGFGNRGVTGKMRAITYAREHKIPFLGICLGMQLAVVEFARNVAGMDDAHSTEFNQQTAYPVIYFIKEWYDYRTGEMATRDKSSKLGGTLRLGSYPCNLSENSFAHVAYGSNDICERHRHRYEFNNKFLDELTEKGLVVSGRSPDNKLVEIIELADHPWFLGCQFHPEFKSSPMKSHPLFKDFIRAALQEREVRKQRAEK